MDTWYKSNLLTYDGDPLIHQDEERLGYFARKWFPNQQHVAEPHYLIRCADLDPLLQALDKATTETDDVDEFQDAIDEVLAAYRDLKEATS